MINIDKLVLAFRTRLEEGGREINLFNGIEKAIEKIDKHNNPPNIDIWDYEKYGIIEQPYRFGKTELKWVDIKKIKTHFRYNYYVLVNNIKIGLLQWGTFGNCRNYGYLNLLNESLYNDTWKLYKQAVKDLGLCVYRISKLDLAFDSVINPTKRYLEAVKDKRNEIVINGDIIKDRSKLLLSPYFITYGTLDDPLKYPQIHFATKDKSTTIKVYNKTEEVENNSHKEYIKEKYNEIEKDIYRCEVSLSSHTLDRIVWDIAEKNNELGYMESLDYLLERLEDNNYLLQLHKDSMYRMIRYSHKTKKRKTILSYYNIN